jgi:hypothetical protein
MKQPWILKVCCYCCCRGPAQRSQTAQQQDSEDYIPTNRDRKVEEANDLSLAEMAINTALRMPSPVRTSGDFPRQRDSTLPPPSYDTAMRDADRSRQRSQHTNRVPVPTNRGRPPTQELGMPVVPNASDDKARQPEVRRSFDSDVVLTPLTTAPPTVVDEDEDEERLGVIGRRG